MLFGEDGDPEKAPLELLNADLAASNGPKVVKFNVDDGGIPKEFNVEYVPAIYLVSKADGMALFEGDPANVPELKSWVLGGVKTAHESSESNDTMPIFLHNASAGSNKVPPSLLRAQARRAPARPW